MAMSPAVRTVAMTTSFRADQGSASAVWKSFRRGFAGKAPRSSPKIDRSMAPLCDGWHSCCRFPCVRSMTGLHGACVHASCALTEAAVTIHAPRKRKGQVTGSYEPAGVGAPHSKVTRLRLYIG